MFDNVTTTKLGYYVYALINPINHKVFYIGKGNQNRVFAHVQEILDFDAEVDSIKKIEIKEILNQGKQIEHYIIRHGLTENEAFLIESTLIDYNNILIYKLTNEVSGHHSAFYGIKTTDELIRQYNAPKLEQLSDSVVIININRKYKETKNKEISVYEATKEAWVIGDQKRNEVSYALAEFQGVIIGVFEILHWYPVQTDNNTNNNRWGFEGKEAPEIIKSKYLNTSIMHAKRRGAANPIRFRL
jgi:hypothetical protein